MIGIDRENMIVLTETENKILSVWNEELTSLNSFRIWLTNYFVQENVPVQEQKEIRNHEVDIWLNLSIVKESRTI